MRKGENRQNQARIGKNWQKILGFQLGENRREWARIGKNWQKDFVRSLSCFVFLPHQNHDKVEDTDAHKTGKDTRQTRAT